MRLWRSHTLSVYLQWSKHILMCNLFLRLIVSALTCPNRWGEGGVCQLDQQSFGERSRLPTSAAHEPQQRKPLCLCPRWHPAVVTLMHRDTHTYGYVHNHTRVTAITSIYWVLYIWSAEWQAGVIWDHIIVTSMTLFHNSHALSSCLLLRS